MLATKQTYPIGVRPLLVEETARRRRVEERIVSILQAASFDEVVVPIIDYADCYRETFTPETRRRGGGAEAYRFVDRDGELVAIRSDFTPMVARALAPAITRDDLPLKVFYRGDVVRYEPSRLGANREIFQIGAEIVGDPSPAADVEILTLVSAILEQSGIEPLIVYTDARIASAPVFAPIELSDVDPAVAATLAAIAAGAPASCSLHLDDAEPARGYYTALRFRAYDASRRRVVAQGGRYDSLYSRFGSDAAAVGFTLTIDDLD